MKNYLKYLLLLMSVVLIYSCSTPGGTKEDYFGYNNNPKMKEEPADQGTSNAAASRAIKKQAWHNPLAVDNADDEGTDNTSASAKVYYRPVYVAPTFVPVIVPWWDRYYDFYDYPYGGVFVHYSYGYYYPYDWYSPWYDYHPFYGIRWMDYPDYAYHVGYGYYWWRTYPYYTYYNYRHYYPDYYHPHQNYTGQQENRSRNVRSFGAGRSNSVFTDAGVPVSSRGSNRVNTSGGIAQPVGGSQVRSTGSSARVSSKRALPAVSNIPSSPVYTGDRYSRKAAPVSERSYTQPSGSRPGYAPSPSRERNSSGSSSGNSGGSYRSSSSSSGSSSGNSGGSSGNSTRSSGGSSGSSGSSSGRSSRK